MDIICWCLSLREHNRWARRKYDTSQHSRKTQQTYIPHPKNKIHYHLSYSLLTGGDISHMTTLFSVQYIYKEAVNNTLQLLWCHEEIWKEASSAISLLAEVSLYIFQVCLVFFLQLRVVYHHSFLLISRSTYLSTIGNQVIHWVIKFGNQTFVAKYVISAFHLRGNIFQTNRSKP